MQRLRLLPILLLTSSLLIGQTQQKPAIDSLFQEWDNIEVPGAAISVIQDGEIIFSNGYGSADLEHDIPITPKTVFYIGSTSKQFVTFCILLLEEQGKIGLDDPIQKFFPDFPEYDGPLTVRNFIHHTSGVRDYLTLMYLKGRNYLDHSSVEEVYELIKGQTELNFTPGQQYLYSNSCYFMLALMVEKASGQSLREFAHENIFEPLGMKNSLFYDDINDLIKNRAFSYEPTGEGFNNLVSRFDLVGSGGVYSTVEDLALWDQNFYNNKLGKGGQEIIEKMHEDGTLNNGESADYAFALINGTYKGLKTVSHGGSLAGYRAQLIRFPDQQFSIAILANRGDANPNGLAYQVADIFLADQFQEEESSETGEARQYTYVTLSEAQLSKFSGSYWNKAEAYSRTIYVKNDTLRYSRGPNNESNLIPISNNEFKMAGVGVDLIVKFGKTTAGDDAMFVTINDDEPIISEAYEPADYEKSDFGKYAGSYFSKELNATYELKMQEEGLVLHLNGIEISPMEAVMENVLTNDRYGIFEFYEGSNGNKAGFRLMAGRVRNLDFRKNSSAN